MEQDDIKNTESRKRQKKDLIGADEIDRFLILHHKLLEKYETKYKEDMNEVYKFIRITHGRCYDYIKLKVYMNVKINKKPKSERKPENGSVDFIFSSEIDKLFKGDGKFRNFLTALKFLDEKKIDVDFTDEELNRNNNAEFEPC